MTGSTVHTIHKNIKEKAVIWLLLNKQLSFIFLKNVAWEKCRLWSLFASSSS